MDIKLNQTSKNKLINILIMLSTFAIALGGVRLYLAGNIKGIFLVWNLFLAWVPLFIALLMEHKNRKILAIKLLLLIPLWLLFLPNAPYLITDLIHLRPRDGVPLWYDASILFLFAFDGLLVGIVSILLIHEMIAQYLRSFFSWIFLSVCFILSGYGIYLGRFLRWNSWDLLVRPVALLEESFLTVTNPTAMMVTAIFSLILFFSYLIFYQLIHLNQPSYDSKDVEKL
ncbi:MAG TPA: DUF1361 domain-containing protein [Cytophagaceae bacterium]|nr:DUF1361 domain-containing protein [Cytophagaceae bacterium]